jgi:hypothetical protein
MERLLIEATKYTPQIILDASKGLLEMRGKSYPENTFEFYQPVLSWIERYFQDPLPDTLLQMEIIYFNSSSSKLFFDLFDLLETYREKSHITIEWIYDPENESALEAGEDFMEDFETLSIQLVEKP